MKKMLLWAGAPILAASLVAAPSAAFASVTYTGVQFDLQTGQNDATRVKLDQAGDGFPPSDTSNGDNVYYSGYFGSFDMIIPGEDTFTSFCLDLLDSISTSGATYTYTALSNPADAFGDDPLGNPDVDTPAETDVLIKQINLFVDMNAGEVEASADTSVWAAFQLALWELAYDGIVQLGDAGQHFTTGLLQADNGGGGTTSVITKATEFLDNLFNPAKQAGTTDDYQITFMDSENNQDQMIIQYNTDNNLAVPLPAAGWLLAGGLAGLFGFGRFRGSKDSRLSA